jgi:hypothetical protein
LILLAFFFPWPFSCGSVHLALLDESVEEISTGKDFQHMKGLPALLGTALLVLLAASASQVRAGDLYWTYTTSLNVPSLTVGGGVSNGGATVTLASSYAPQSEATWGQGGFNSIPVLWDKASFATLPMTFGPSVNSPSTFNLAITIEDNASRDSGTLNFTGTLSGTTFDPSTGGGTLGFSFTPVTSNSLTLDGHTYTVTFPFAPFGPPGWGPEIDARVTTTGGTGGTPEPSSLLLGSLGFSCFGLRGWWKRRRRRPEHPAEVA